MPLYPVKFAFSTGSSDRVEAVITAPKEQRCILHGTVYDENGQRVSGAVVCLYLREQARLTPAGNTFTDADGEFVFGALAADSDYLVKVYHGGALLREITVRPRKKRKPEETCRTLNMQVCDICNSGMTGVLCYVIIHS